MWPCEYCGRENPEDAVACEVCGTLRGDTDYVGDGDNPDSQDLFFDDEYL